MNTASPPNVAALASAARMPARWKPYVWREFAGRSACRLANQASAMASTSVSMWPASLSRARLIEASPPPISRTRTMALTPRATASRWLGAAPCWCPACALRRHLLAAHPAEPDGRSARIVALPARGSRAHRGPGVGLPFDPSAIIRESAAQRPCGTRTRGHGAGAPEEAVDGCHDLPERDASDGPTASLRDPSADR